MIDYHFRNNMDNDKAGLLQINFAQLKPLEPPLMGLDLSCLDLAWVDKLQNGATTWDSQVLTTHEAVPDQSASRKILGRQHSREALVQWLMLPKHLYLVAEQVEQNVLRVPSLIGKGYGLTPTARFRAGEVVMQIGARGEWVKYEGERAGPGLQVAFQKAGGSSNLTLLHPLDAEKHLCCSLHCLESVHEIFECQKLLVLECEWLLSTQANPILQLRAPRDIGAFEGEFAVDLKTVGSPGASWRDHLIISSYFFRFLRTIHFTSLYHTLPYFTILYHTLPRSRSNRYQNTHTHVFSLSRLSSSQPQLCWI